jgi:hypothetical protein
VKASVSTGTTPTESARRKTERSAQDPQECDTPRKKEPKDLRHSEFAEIQMNESLLVDNARPPVIDQSKQRRRTKRTIPSYFHRTPPEDLAKKRGTVASPETKDHCNDPMDPASGRKRRRSVQNFTEVEGPESDGETNEDAKPAANGEEGEKQREPEENAESSIQCSKRARPDKASQRADLIAESGKRMTQDEESLSEFIVEEEVSAADLSGEILLHITCWATFQDPALYS